MVLPGPKKVNIGPNQKLWIVFLLDMFTKKVHVNFLYTSQVLMILILKQ